MSHFCFFCLFGTFWLWFFLERWSSYNACWRNILKSLILEFIMHVGGTYWNPSSWNPWPVYQFSMVVLKKISWFWVILFFPLLWVWITFYIKTAIDLPGRRLGLSWAVIWVQLIALAIHPTLMLQNCKPMYNILDSNSRHKL